MSARANQGSYGLRPRGAVLLMVLVAVALLSLMAVELARTARLDVAHSLRAERDASMRLTIDSGVEAAKSMLYDGRKRRSFDTLHDDWVRPLESKVDERTSIAVKLSDESGKINIIKATRADADGAKARKSLARLFAYLCKIEPDREAAWRAAEAGVQSRLGINASGDGLVAAAKPESDLATLDCLREAGVERALLFGSQEAEGVGQNRIALCDLLTIFGDGRVNLNTAPAAVLYALDEEYDEALVSRIQQWRGFDTGVAAETGKPFETAKDLEQIQGVVETALVGGRPTVVKNLYLKIQERLCVQGSYFSARIEAHCADQSCTAIAYLLTPNTAVSNVESTVSKAGSIQVLAVEELEP